MERQQRTSRYWFITLLILCGLIAIVQAQQPFVHGSDIGFTIRTDHKRHEIGSEITVRYTITNVSNAAIYVPKKEWGVACGEPPHLWGRLEDRTGKHYEPGYAGSCGSSPGERISERMQKDAVLLKPGQLVSGSFAFESKVFGKSLKPGAYRLEVTLYGWNLPYSEAELAQLNAMKAPFLTGESNASVLIELENPGKPRIGGDKLPFH